MSFTRASTVPPPKLSTSRSTFVDSSGKFSAVHLRPVVWWPRGRRTLLGGAARSGDAPVGRNGTPARRGLLVTTAPWWGWSCTPPTRSDAAASASESLGEFARRHVGSSLHLPGGPQGTRLAWVVRHSGRAPVRTAPRQTSRAANRPRAKGQGSEEDLPAQHQETGQEPRVSTPDVHPCREGDTPGAPGQRSPPPLRVRAERPLWAGVSGTGRHSRSCGAADTGVDGVTSP